MATTVDELLIKIRADVSDVQTKLKKFESGQQGNLLKMTQTGTKLTQANPGGLPTIKVPVGTKGKFKTVVAPTKFAKGTVDEFNRAADAAVKDRRLMAIDNDTKTILINKGYQSVIDHFKKN